MDWLGASITWGQYIVLQAGFFAMSVVVNILRGARRHEAHG
jgi:hypothetical protein